MSNTSNPLFKLALPLTILSFLQGRSLGSTFNSKVVLVGSGIITAYLWNTNCIQFLGLEYWGQGMMGLLCLASMLSFKACWIQNKNHTSRNSSSSSSSSFNGPVSNPYNHNHTTTNIQEEDEEGEALVSVYESAATTSRNYATTTSRNYTTTNTILSALLSWIDYVSWDEDGQMILIGS